jgi:hypothetical protein
MSNTITPNMSLIVPGVGTEASPTWATDLNSDLAILDQHNHSNGQGVQITPAGLNINSDLPINGNNLTLVNSVELNNLSSPLAGAAPHLTTIYASGGNLYYNDAAGNQIKMTSSGSVNATSSGIASGTATASFSAGTLVVDSNTNTPAAIQGGPISIGNIVANSNFATLQAPNSLASNYTLTLPPNNSTGGAAFLTYDASNNIGVGPATTAGITGSNIASQTLTQGLRAPMTVGTTATAGNFALSASSGVIGLNGNQTLLTATLTTTGRPVALGLISDGSGNDSSYTIITSGTNLIFTFANNGTQVSTQFTNMSNAGMNLPVSIFNHIDTSIAGSPGTYTYTFNVIMPTVGSPEGALNYAKLFAYEI